MTITQRSKGRVTILDLRGHLTQREGVKELQRADSRVQGQFKDDVTFSRLRPGASVTPSSEG